MGAHHSQGSEDLGKDDSTQATRSTKSSIARKSIAPQAVASHSASRTEKATSFTRQSGHRRHRRKRTRSSRSTTELFALHGISIESFDAGSLQQVVGSFGMDRKNLTQRPSQPTSIPQARPGNGYRSGNMRSLSLNSADRDYREISRLVEHDAESLPRPTHERQRKVEEFLRQQSATSSPVQCPPQTGNRHDTELPAASHSLGETEYLSRLYDIRTWNMYKLIKETRDEDRAQVQPQMSMVPMPSHQLRPIPGSPGEISETEMAFPMDMESS